MSDPETFKYFAFISYSRKDSRAAAFLHRKLEKFRIPTKRVPEEMRRGLHKFVRPVFRDKRDLEVGDSSFTEDVKRALEESRFIIVLCSPNSARSTWVDNEIRYFLSTHGGDLSKVVPVVLAGNPGSGDTETECLCSCLFSEKVKPIIIKRNLPTMIPDEGEPEKVGWEAGIVGVLSYMLKVKRHDIKVTIDAEKVRQMRIYAAIGVICSAIFAVLSFWAVTAEQTARQNWQLAEDNKKQALEQRDRAVEAERLAVANRQKAEANEKRAVAGEKRAVAGEKEAREKAYLAEQTVDFLKRMLQEARPDEHGAKNVIDLLMEQQSKVDLLKPAELRYSVSRVLGQVLLEQSLPAPASRLLKYAYDFSKSNGMTNELAGAANLLAVAYNQMSGHSDEALALLAEVEELKRVAGDDDVSMASTLGNMAAAYFVKGDFAKSRELCDKALALIGDEPCPAGLLALGQSARIANELGEYKQAEAYCERIFRMYEVLKAEPDPDYVEIYVGTCYRLGKYMKGKNLAEETLDKVRKSGGDARAMVLLENDLGLIKVELGDVQGAIVNYQNAIQGAEKIWPDGQVTTKANIYNNLGAAYLAVGGTHRAVPIFKKAVEMLESHGGGDSDGLYLPLVNLGLAYRRTGEREKALAAYERAYGICVKKAGPDSVHLATVIEHIARVKEELGAQSEAKVGFEEVLRILEKNNSLNTPLAVSAMCGLAELQFSGGEREKASSTISNAVELARRILPPGNVLRGNIMRTYEKIRQRGTSEVVGLSDLEKSWSAKKQAANRALDDNRNDEARALYLEMLRHLEETGQTLTQEYALVCNQLGILANRNEDPASALAYYTKSRDVHFSISATNDIEVAIPCYNAAIVLEKLGDLDGAEQAFMRALPAYEAASKDNLSLIYTKLGRIKESQKKLAEALAWHRKALAFDASLKGTNSVYVAADRENIGDIHKENGEYAAAVTNYKAAVAVRLSTGEPPDSAKMCKLENDIAIALQRDGKVRKAAEHYRRAYEIGLHNFGLTNVTTVTVLANLGSCEKSLGEYAGAIEHLALAADMKKAMSEFDAHSVSLTVNDLAIAYSRNGDFDKAIQTLNVALKYALRAWGRENEEVMTIYGNIAFEYEHNGKADEAIGYYRKALDIALLLHGNAGERTRQYYRDLGDCLYKAGKYDKCAAIRKTYLDVVREVGTLGPEYAAKAHMLYSDALWALDDYAGSASNRACAVEAYRACGEGYLESVAVSLCKLGYSLRSLGEFKSAAEVFSEAKRIFENTNLTYEKGGDVDLGIHQKLEESRRLASGQLWLVIKMIKITEGGQADRLGVKKGDVWCALDEWKADDYPDGKGLWDSLVKAMAHFQEKPRQLTVWRLDNGEWKKKTFQFDGSLGEFTYGYDVLSAENFHAMKASCK